MNVGIGSKVFVCDGYVRNPKTLEDELRKWAEYEIVGETKASWIAQRGQWSDTQIKIDKKTLALRGNGIDIAWTREEIETNWRNEQFLSDHGYRIGEFVQRCHDVEKLRKVADIIGYRKHLE